MVKNFHENTFRDEFVEAWFRFSVDQELTCGREVEILVFFVHWICEFMIKGLRESLVKDADKEAHASSRIPGLFHFSHFPLVKSLIVKRTCEIIKSLLLRGPAR